MKPFAEQDFPVGVWRESRNHAGPSASMYEGVYDVTLNHTISIDFVPGFGRGDPWPPELPADIDRISSFDEARRTIVALAQYAVTPDDGRAGTVERFTRDGSATVIFHVTTTAFDELNGELRTLSERLTGVHDAVKVSELHGSSLAQLLTHIVTSGYLTQYQLGMLGR